jgi:hypothetical protein
MLLLSLVTPPAGKRNAHSITASRRQCIEQTQRPGTRRHPDPPAPPAPARPGLQGPFFAGALTTGPVRARFDAESGLP